MQQQTEQSKALTEKEEHAATVALRARSTFPFSIETAITTVGFSQIGGSGAATSAKYGTALSNAIRAATAHIASAAVSASASISIGALALVWPSTLGNGERQLSISFPLELLTPPPSINMTELAASGGSIHLSYKPAAESSAEQLKLFITRSRGVSVPGNVQVRQAHFDNEANVYSLALDSPLRILTWTPNTAPGDEGNMSTSLPEEQQLTLTYRGPIATPNEGQIEIYPAKNLLGLTDLIVTFPSGSGVPPLYVMFSEAHSGTTTIGESSGRPYNPENAGGEIEKLDWADASVTREGIDQIKLHTSRFDKSADNDVMLGRLEAILTGTLQVTDTDKRFYTHEIRELARYRNIGVADGDEAGREVWNNAHTAALEDFRLRDLQSLFYTPEADAALQKQLEELFK